MVWCWSAVSSGASVRTDPGRGCQARHESTYRRFGEEKPQTPRWRSVAAVGGSVVIPMTGRWNLINLPTRIDESRTVAITAGETTLPGRPRAQSLLHEKCNIRSMADDWRDRIEAQREQKEEYFRNDPRSPAPDDFAGLDYYPIDPDYRFEVPLDRYDEPEEISVETTADGEQRYRRVGSFAFDIDGESVSIDAFEPANGENRLWVPVRDATSGSETYGAGRYLDLEPETHMTDNGWIVDFNAAYNPTCAYNAAYECPLVPASNWIDVPIEAGEKAYPGDPAGHN